MNPKGAVRMKMGSNLWRFKYKLKRNPTWVLAPFLLMGLLLFARVFFMWKYAFSSFLILLWIGIGVGIGLGLGTGKKKAPKRKMSLKKWPPRRTIR
jgi:hypothetical protein